jgi:hypothetical protein
MMLSLRGLSGNRLSGEAPHHTSPPRAAPGRNPGGIREPFTNKRRHIMAPVRASVYTRGIG